MKGLIEKQGGFSLLEVMIAVFVLAIGLLGLAGLQLTSMQNTHSAFLRSQATLAAYSIIDDARANTANRDDYAIALASSASSAGGQAERDVNAWLGNLAAELPAGDGSVVFLGTADPKTGTRPVRVTVQWTDRGTQASATPTLTFTAETEI